MKKLKYGEKYTVYREQAIGRKAVLSAEKLK